MEVLHFFSHPVKFKKKRNRRDICESTRHVEEGVCQLRVGGRDCMQQDEGLEALAEKDIKGGRLRAIVICSQEWPPGGSSDA